jgi:hypothetical protein
MRTKLSITVMLMLATMLVNGQFLPKVDKVKSDDMSMLAVHFGQEDETGKLVLAQNMNWSGWAPAVVGPDGEEVAFRNFDSGADITNIYYAENLKAGEYTLTGFYHVYTDFSKLEPYKAQSGEKMARYAPYEKLPYHVRQHFPLSSPVKIDLKANSMAAFGTFMAKYEFKEAFYGGTSDDRSKVVEETFKYVTEKPMDDYILRYMKPWATPAWKKWNAKNPATPLGK